MAVHGTRRRQKLKVNGATRTVANGCRRPERDFFDRLEEKEQMWECLLTMCETRGGRTAVILLLLPFA